MRFAISALLGFTGFFAVGMAMSYDRPMRKARA
jgi:hypothetical protein